MRRRNWATALALTVTLGMGKPALAGSDPGPVDPSAPQVPLNFTSAAYARGLDHPGPMLVLPNGDLLVVVRNGVALLREVDASGVADVEIPLVADIGQPLGLALRRDKLYIATADGLYTCTYLVGRLRVVGHCRPIGAWPDDAGTPVRGGFAFNRDETTLYVVLAGGRSAPGVWAMQPDGKNARRQASLAGSVLAIEPRKGGLWTADADGALVAPAAAVVEPLPVAVRGAVTGLAFYARDRFPREFRGGLFIAEAGRGEAEPARISYVSFDSARPNGTATDFVGPFQQGAPDALATTRDGALLIADAARGTVWRIAFRCGACTPDPVVPPPRRR